MYNTSNPVPESTGLRRMKRRMGMNLNPKNSVLSKAKGMTELKMLKLHAKLDGLIQFGPIEDASFQAWRRKKNIHEALTNIIEKHYPGKSEEFLVNALEGRFNRLPYLIKQRQSGRKFVHGLPRGVVD